MEKYLNKGIKDIITEFPQIGKLLDGYEIGCTTCQLGSCQLKDIVSIHNLAADAEQELFSKMAAIIYPGQDVVLPRYAVKAKAAAAKKKASPPIARMTEEHTFIKQILSLIPDKIAMIDISTDEGSELIRRFLDFIRNYADKYHHAKEEEILFKYFDQSADIIQVMLGDHVNGRNYVRGAAAALVAGNKGELIQYLTAYRDLLSGHIQREDEILYPWMDRELSIGQVGELFNLCRQVDDKFNDIRKVNEAFAMEMSVRFS